MAMVEFQMGDSDDEFEQISEEERLSGKAVLVVLIEATPKMFEGWEDNKETPFVAALKCCESIWRSKVVSNAQDLVSIIFYGTEESKNSSGFPNIYEFQELSKVKVDMIKELIETRSSEDLSGFAEKIGSSGTYSFKDLFWLVKINLDKAKTQTFVKKMMIFTAEDNPHGDNPNLQTDAASKFKDLGKIDLSIVSFKENFQFEKFYDKLEEDQDSSIVTYSKDLDSLQQVVRMKQRLKRPISRSVLELTSQVKIGVGFYSLVRPAAPPKKININKRNNEVVEKNVNVYRSNTGMPVLKSEERKMVRIQGEVAVFTPQEIKEVKQVQEPGLKLLAFVRSHNFDPCFHFLWYRSPGYFLYPDEQRISGSKELFTTLLQRCVIMERAILVRYVLSRGRSPKLGLLLPSYPEDNDSSTFPQGFHLFPVPFTDEIRKHDLESQTKATPKLTELMQKVVKKLTFTNFNILHVQNPSLQSIWKSLEEEALEQDVEDDFFDYTEPNNELMKKKLKDIPEEISAEVDRVCEGFQSAKSNALVKKSKFTVDIEMEAKNGRLNSCTIAQMTEFLDSRRVKKPDRPRKADIIELVKKTLGIQD